MGQDWVDRYTLTTLSSNIAPLEPIFTRWSLRSQLRSNQGAEGGISRIFTKRGSIESYSSADYSAAHESALFLTDRELYNFEFRAPFHTAHA